MPHDAFHAALDEAIERRELTEAIRESVGEVDIADKLFALGEEYAGDPEGFTAAVRKLVLTNILVALWPRLREMAQLAEGGAERRAKALAAVSREQLLATPAITKDDVARRIAERTMGEGDA